MGVAIGIALGALLLAIVMWVYFDALESGKPAVGWALGMLALGWLLVPLILYVIFRDTGTRNAVPPGGAQRQVRHVFGFVGFSAAAFALALLLGATFVEVAVDDAIAIDTYRQIVAGSISTGVASAILWAAIWFPWEAHLPGIAADDQFRAAFYLYRGHIITLMVVTGVVVFLSALTVFAGLLSTALGVEDVATEDWLWALGPLIVALWAAVFHYWGYLRSQRYGAMLARFESIPRPPLLGAAALASSAAAPRSEPTASPVAGRFCGQCGARLMEGQRFCSSCGTAVPA